MKQNTKLRKTLNRLNDLKVLRLNCYYNTIRTCYSRDEMRPG